MPTTHRAEYTEKLIALFNNHEAFTELSSEEKAHFADRAKFKFYEQGTKVVHQGDEGNEFFIVIEGQLRAVDVYHDPPRLLNYHSPGDMIGLRIFLGDEVRAATIEVVSDAKLAVYDRDDWEWLLSNHSRIQDYAENIERAFRERSTQHFPGRQWDEVVVIGVKRHWLAFASSVLKWPLFFLMAPFIFIVGVEVLGALFNWFPSNLYWWVPILISAPFFLLFILLAVYYYVDWRNDDFIVTTKRVIHIERILFYGEERREAPLTRIQNVAVQSKSAIDSFFNCHDLVIKTAGVGDITIDKVVHGEELQSLILQEQKRAKERVAADDVASIRQIVADRVGMDLPKNVLGVAEAEGQIHRQEESPRRLPKIFGVDLDYLWPRTKHVTKFPVGGTMEPAIVWRRHLIILAATLFLPTLSVLILAYLLVASFFILWPLSLLTGWISLVLWPIIQIGLAILLLAAMIWYAWEYDDWGKDAYIVTESRIIDMEGSPFNLKGDRLRREGTFDKIENVYYTIPTFFSKLFNLGDVIIETASQEGSFTFEQVYNPSAVQEEIFNRWAVHQQRQKEKDRDATTKQVVRVLGEYHQLMHE